MINFKNLGKALKYNKSSGVFWFRKDEYNYLFTNYWAIRTTKQLHIEKGIFTALINMFQAIPEVSKGIQLMNNYTGVEQMKEQRMKSQIELMQNIPDSEVTRTGLMTELNYNIKEVEILKAPNNYIFVDRVFMNFINVTPETKLYGRGPHNPIYVQSDEELAMLLPVRCDITPEHLKPIEREEL